jgi:hypothetical protein
MTLQAQGLPYTNVERETRLWEGATLAVAQYDAHPSEMLV